MRKLDAEEAEDVRRQRQERQEDDAMINESAFVLIDYINQTRRSQASS